MPKADRPRINEICPKSSKTEKFRAGGVALARNKSAISYIAGALLARSRISAKARENRVEVTGRRRGCIM